MRDVTTTTSLEVKGRPYWKKYRTEVVPGQGSMSGQTITSVPSTGNAVCLVPLSGEADGAH